MLRRPDVLKKWCESTLRRAGDRATHAQAEGCVIAHREVCPGRIQQVL